ncbi:hypothetical protein [Streptomyces sp. NPDC058280]|uniref:hypothetical protein n=1 Tax=Streptomyces sp. NPDC058280 TaxID=3346419 RepID=UPI0036E7DAD0
MSFHSVAKHALTVYYDGDADLAGKVMDGVAHELAERIRGMEADVIRMSGRRMSDIDVVADLIDPEVKP